MSFSKGKKNETSIKHNNRSIENDFDFDKKGHQHIKRQYTSMNKVLVHDDIRDVYKREFGQAVDEYNKRQKRKDRKIDDYYSKIKHSKRDRTQYEFLVQVGNRENFDVENRKTSQLWQDGKEILEKYLTGFQKRNPNLVVYNAVIHMDEEGAPHMHMNIVPVAHTPNAKRGLKVRPALNKALAEEGFPISKEDNRKQFRDFQHREADALADIARDYGIERQEGIKNKLKDVHEYKEAMRRADEIDRNIDEVIETKVKERTQELEKKNKELEEKNNKLIQLNNALSKTLGAVLEGFRAEKDKMGSLYHRALNTAGIWLRRAGLTSLSEHFDDDEKKDLKRGYGYAVRQERVRGRE